MPKRDSLLDAIRHSVSIAIVGVRYSIQDVRAIWARILPPISQRKYWNIKEVKKLPVCLAANERNSRRARSFNRVHHGDLQFKKNISMFTG